MDKAFAFRLAVNADYERLLRCDPFAQITPARRTSLKVALKAQQIHVVECSEAIKGFVVIENSFFGHAFVSLIAVDPTSRRQGYALALLAKSEQVCSSEKLFTSTNASNVAAKKLFLRAGFVASGHIDNLDADDTELVYFKSVNSQLPHS